MTTKTKPSFIGSIFLVIGTCVGAGILGLPVETAEAGFFPSLVLYGLCYLAMTLSGLLFLEITLWMKHESNIISMTNTTLGPVVKALAWIIYIGLFYSLTFAYTKGILNFFINDLALFLPQLSSFVIFFFLFVAVVYIGTRAVEAINSLLLFGLIASYAAFVIIGLNHVQADFLTHSNWRAAIFSMPLIITSFGFHGIIPSLCSYLKNDVKKLRLCIIIGTLGALIIYIIWQTLVMGIIPLEGDFGLLSAHKNDATAIAPFKAATGNAYIYQIGQIFAFCALSTSLLGVGLGLRDFLSDGLKIKKTRKGRALLCALIFTPPLLLASTSLNVFYLSLHYGAGLGCILLLILLPALMALRERGKKGFEPPYRMRGGKAVLFGLIAFSLIAICLEIYQLV